MSERAEIKCDACGSDLATTTNCEAYRIVLRNEHIPPAEGFVTAMAAYPPLKKPRHFCGTRCLYAWVIGRAPAA